MRARLIPSLLTLTLLSSHGVEDPSAFRIALDSAERALSSEDYTKARDLIQRALERDRKSPEAWSLRARWAEAVDDKDELVYSLHREYRLSAAQDVDKDTLTTLRARLETVDPVATDLYGMDERFVGKLLPIAAKYESDGRPHSAIRVLKQILSLDPENELAQTSIERIASAPDPSLAGDAKPKDLFEGISEEWIREHDLEHSTWDNRAVSERDNYKTYTDAGFVVLTQAAEAMEQMNAFYRVFFQYGTEEDGKSVPRIGLNIFKSREEYLELGIGPPVEWSGGHFTGNFVETYIGPGGFQEMTGTLFHEAAHQFVSLATSATGWLNEGLASFFEGTRILPNGTVIMNMPANHRLYPLAGRMETGWMESAEDGFDPNDATASPTKAPTFKIILENEYEWGPAWYAPTWGLVYFLYNYQDPIDGRFVYRASFHEFINKSGGRTGKGAVKNFEEVVLANPSRRIKGVERPEDAADIELPTTCTELDEIWKQWCIDLRQEQRGLLVVERPYKLWGRYAAMSGDYVIAQEHFEKGLVETPDDIELLIEFAELLDKHFGNVDRAAKLVLEAIHYVESKQPVDGKRLKELERLLAKLDPKQRTLTKVQDEMAATGREIVGRYEAEGLSLMVMDVAWRLGTRQNLPDLFANYEAAARRSGKSLRIWDLAYNESNLDGWNTAGIESAFQADGTFLTAESGEYSETRFDYQVLTLDRITSGDFSMDADVLANKGEVNFCGFVFGQKQAGDFHGMVLFPGKSQVAEGTVDTGFLQLMSTVGGQPQIWRNLPVKMETEAGRSSAGQWHKLRIDVSGPFVDMWFDGRLLATHEFPSREVVQGNFGLLIGPGKARFRNVRYLASDRRDPAARIERDVRLEEIRGDGTGPVDGSYLGLVPPFPHVDRWVQGKRSNWTERGPVPQLLVFFSIGQNQIVPIDGWLRWLAEEREEYGLEIIAIASPNDADKMDEWLKEHELPGSVAVDHRDGTGIGESFESFFIQRFNLPRLLLLDLDGTVAWEGDPGLPAGEDEGGPYSTYLKDPLNELIEKRQLHAISVWMVKWQKRALPALERGDPLVAVEALIDARDLESRYHPEVARARAAVEAVDAALADLAKTGRELQEQDAGPAFAALLEWAPSFGVEIESPELKKYKKLAAGDAMKDWSSALKRCDKVATKKKVGRSDAVGLLEFLRKKEGPLVEDLIRDLEPLVEAGDLEAVRALATGASGRAGAWLASEYFGW